MKKLNTFFFLALILSAGFLNAQTNPEWKSIWFNSNSDLKGVGGEYLLTKCNNVEVILIRLVNHNNYSVKAGWSDMIINNERQRIFSDRNDSITLGPISEVEGDCTNNFQQLCVKLSSFNINGNDFKSFSVVGFDLKRID